MREAKYHTEAGCRLTAGGGRQAGSLNLKLKQKSAAGGVVCLLPLLLVRRWIRSAGRQTDRKGVEISAAWKPAVQE